MCKGVIIYKNGDRNRFDNHMNNEHGIVFEIDFLFAICKLGENDRLKVKEVIDQELYVDLNSREGFNEESVKMQLRKIIPSSNKRSPASVFQVNEADDDIEVISSLSPKDNEIVSKEAELEQISKRRKLSSDSSTSSVGSSHSSISKARSIISNPSPRPYVPSFDKPDDGPFRRPSIPMVVQTPRKTPTRIPAKTPRKSSHNEDQNRTNGNSKSHSTLLKTPTKASASNNAHTLSLTTSENIEDPGEDKSPEFSTPKKFSNPRLEQYSVPPSTSKKRNSIGGSSFPCDLCNKVYSSTQARKHHMKKKHSGSSLSNTERDSQEESQDISLNLPIIPLLDQGVVTSVRDAPSSSQLNIETKDDDESSRVSVKLFSCDGCSKSYASSMKLRMHKKRSCKVGLNSSIKDEAQDYSVATLEESSDAVSNDEEKDINHSTVPSNKSETDEIQNMLMMDNSDEDFDDVDEDLELVDIVVDKKSKVQKENSVGHIKNETQLETNEDTDSNRIDLKEKDVQSWMIEECSKSQYFTDNPAVFSKCLDDNLPSFLKSLKFLPGWKLKKNEVKKKNGERIPATHFLSPEGVVIRSGLGVLEYLKIGGADIERLKAVSLKLKVRPTNFEKYLQNYVLEL